MEMAFGILYGPFSQAAGPFLGQILGYETITAFMYEAGFIGLMVFGWGKIGKKMHLFATANVAIASSLSAICPQVSLRLYDYYDVICRPLAPHRRVSALLRARSS